MQPEPKICLAEIIYLTIAFGLTDIIGIILVVFGLDDFFLLDVIRFPLSQLYLRIKGVKGTATLVANILECIPYIGALPAATIGWLITVWLDRHPAIEAKIASVAAPLGKAAAEAKLKRTAVYLNPKS